MLSLYDALKERCDTTAKKDAMTRAESLIHDLIGCFVRTGYAKGEVPRLITAITEQQLQEQEALKTYVQISSPIMQQREEKIKLLQAKWEPKRDSEEKRRISDLIFSQENLTQLQLLTIYDQYINLVKLVKREIIHFYRQVPKLQRLH